MDFTVTLVGYVEYLALWHKLAVKYCCELLKPIAMQKWSKKYVKWKKYRVDKLPLINEPCNIDWLVNTAIKQRENSNKKINNLSIVKLLNNKNRGYLAMKNTIYEKECSKCGKFNVKLLKCAGCNNEYYCSKKCQKKDWIYHKSHCQITKQQTRKYE